MQERQDQKGEFPYSELYIASRLPIIWSVGDVILADQSGGICCC